MNLTNYKLSDNKKIYFVECITKTNKVLRLKCNLDFDELCRGFCNLCQIHKVVIVYEKNPKDWILSYNY